TSTSRHRQELSNIPLPWERVLWRARPLSPLHRARGERYVLTDLRLLILTRDRVQELALGDIADVARSESALERVFGVSTLSIVSRRSQGAPLRLTSVRTSADDGE